MNTLSKFLAGLLIGLGIGWAWGGFGPAVTSPSGESAILVSAPAQTKSTGADESDRIVVRPSELSRILDDGNVAGITCATYAGKDVVPPFGENALTARLGMNEKQVAEFHRIFRQAAESRLAWEKSNARVRELGRGEWEIHIPGDGGLADRTLLDELTRAFGTELADRIQWECDLDGFFNLQEIDPDYRHGTLLLRARQERIEGPLASVFGNDNLRVAVQSEEKIVTFHLNDGSLQHSRLGWRLIRLLGGDEAIRSNSPIHILGQRDRRR